MIQAIENMNEFYKQKRIDFMHQAISLPGVAMRVCFNSITDPAAEFHLFNEKNNMKISTNCLNRTSSVVPVLFSIDTTKLVKLSFETILINIVRKSSAMTQMHFIFGP